jgi:iron complex outermembrane receptor protein
VLFTTNNYPNFGVRPETGFNYNVGAVVTLGNFRGSIDYYRVKVDDIIRPLSTANLITAIVQPGATGAAAPINCSSGLITESQPLLGNRPFVQLNGACVQGTSALNSTAGNGGLTGGAINFFGGQGTQPNLFNGGSLETSGLDMSATWFTDDVWDGRLTISADATWTMTYDVSAFEVGGVVVSAGYDGVGFYGSNNAGRNGQRVPEYRASISFNYNRGPHNLNWTTRVISSLISDDNAALFTALNSFNANIGNGAGVQLCQAINQQSPPAPVGAGTAQYGAFCAQQNVLIQAGRREPTWFNTDVTYRLTLPWRTTVTVSVQNLFDRDPPFARDILNYDAFFGSPLGRTVRFQILKTF